MIFLPAKENKYLSGIYIITNTIDSRVYIGECNNFYKRYGRHRSSLKRNKHCNKKLQNFVNKYGLDCLKFDILEIASENLIDLEIQYIKKYNSIENGFNIILDSRTMKHLSIQQRVKGRVKSKGYKIDAEGRKNISKGLKEYYKDHPGSKRAKWTEERKQARREYIKNNPEKYANRKLSSGNKINHKCGSQMSNTNLTEDTVYNIKIDIKNKVKRAKILSKYNISVFQYKGIKSGRNWKHVNI